MWPAYDDGPPLPLAGASLRRVVTGWGPNLDPDPIEGLRSFPLLLSSRVAEVGVSVNKDHALPDRSYIHDGDFARCAKEEVSKKTICGRKPRSDEAVVAQW